MSWEEGGGAVVAQPIRKAPPVEMCGSDAGFGREWCNGVFPEEEVSIAVVRSWSIAVVATKE